MKRLLSFFASVVLFGAQSLQAQWIQTNGPSGGGVTCFAVDGSNLFAGTYNGVFLSTNNGTSWTAVNTGLTNTIVLSLAVNGSNLFAGTDGGGVFFSTNDGASWTAVNTGLTNTIVLSLAVSASNLFAGTFRGGVFLSTNNGTSWTAVNTGLTSTFVNAFAVSASNLFAGTGDGVFLSTDNGTSWTAVNAGLTNTGVKSLAVNDSNLFAGTDDGGVFLSTDNGTSWTTANNGLTTGYVSALAVSGTNLFAGTDGGVFLSTNNGTSWTEVNTGLTNTFVNALAVNGSNLFAGTDGGGVWRRPLSDMVTGRALVIHDTSAAPSDTIDISLRITDASGVAGAQLAVTYNPKILTVLGAQTTVLTKGFLLADSVSTGKIAIAMARDTSIAGGSGSLVNLTFVVNPTATPGDTTTLAFAKLSLFDDKTNPIAATTANGVFTVSGITGVSEGTALPQSYNLLQNYPNPFLSEAKSRLAGNPKTSIRYQLSKESSVRLQIYNLHGQLVRTLVDAKMKAGEAATTWDGKNAAGDRVPSGAYFYRLQVNGGEWTSTRKMMVIR
jgi:hypothetical protein